MILTRTYSWRLEALAEQRPAPDAVVVAFTVRADGERWAVWGLP